MRLRRPLLVLMMLPGIAFALTAEELGILPEPNRIEFAQNGESARYFNGDELPELAPTISIRDQIRSDLKGIDANIGVEVLFDGGSEPTPEQMLQSANVLLSFSRLTGLEYFSASRERMRLLFETSYTTNPEHPGDRLPDQRVSVLPVAVHTGVFQRDLSFGENSYAVDFEATDNVLHLRMENLTSITYGPIRLMKPHAMRMHVYLVRGAGTSYYYAVFGARAFTFSLLEKRIFNSYYHRLAALYGWFVDERSRR